MSEYHKINNVFDRDKQTGKLIAGMWSRPEFGYLADNVWMFTEKVDGMNIRVEYNNGDIKFYGKTNNALIPQELLIKLNNRFITQIDKMKQMFGDSVVTLYGEGYGPNIQKHGELYSDKQDFILFDVKIGNTWLERCNVQNIAVKLLLDIVPYIGLGKLEHGIEWVTEGFKSLVSNKGRMAEGLIARPQVEMLDRLGKRIIAKIKHVDFRK